MPNTHRRSTQSYFQYRIIYFLDFTNITDKFGKTPIHMLAKLDERFLRKAKTGNRGGFEFYKSRFDAKHWLPVTFRSGVGMYS